MYIDVHCHLDMLKSIDKVVERGRRKRVGVVVGNGVKPSVNRKVLGLAEKYKEVKACLGIYPIDALSLSNKEIGEEIEFIRKNAHKIVGIGEVGLDFKEDVKKHDKQKKIFERFIKLSTELDLPITVHSRKAEIECIEILENLGAEKVIMHYFSGKLKLVNRIIENGWYLSIPTSVKNSEHFQKVVEKVPIESLLCETDSPYSHPDKKFPNEPGNVVESYKMIAKIKKIKLVDVEKKVEENFKRLFG